MGCYENPCYQPCLENTSRAFFVKTYAIGNLRKKTTELEIKIYIIGGFEFFFKSPTANISQPIDL